VTNYPRPDLDQRWRQRAFVLQQPALSLQMPTGLAAGISPSPLLATTPWHGMMIGTGVAAMISPIARAGTPVPLSAASSP
jgi:hypothetical protein